MSDSDLNEEFSRYFLKRKSSEFQIKKEDIFYRDKYNEIINYIKVIFTNSESAVINKFMKPKGTLLINVNLGSDILDFIKLIARNYYLEFYELNHAEIIETPREFLKNFGSIIESAFINNESQNTKNKELNIKEGEVEEKGIDTNPSESKMNKKIILIDQQLDNMNAFHNKSLLNNFAEYIYLDQKSISFIDRNIILVWINYNYNEIIDLSNKIHDIFDLFIKVPLLNDLERETVLTNFSERHSNISFDISTLLKYTEGWEIEDIRRLLKSAVFKHYLNAELNDTSNEVTEILIKLIEDGEFIPSHMVNAVITQNSNRLNHNKPIVKKLNSQIKGLEGISIEEKENLIDQIKEQSISEFMLYQLYENAASKNYGELLLIIDKLQKNEPLEDNDKRLLAKYPFILNDSPTLAQINLEKAKKRVDQLTRAFGK